MFFGRNVEYLNSVYSPAYLNFIILYMVPRRIVPVPVLG